MGGMVAARLDGLRRRGQASAVPSFISTTIIDTVVFSLSLRFLSSQHQQLSRLTAPPRLSAPRVALFVSLSALSWTSVIRVIFGSGR